MALIGWHTQVAAVHDRRKAQVPTGMTLVGCLVLVLADCGTYCARLAG